MTKLLTLATALAALVAAAAPGLTGSERLSAVYEAILAARFDSARAQLALACPPAPAEACLALAPSIVWWQIQIDPDDRRLDGELQTTARRAIEAGKRWTEREPDRAEAWFYYAGAHAALTQWRILRRERLAAARDARTVKSALERALALDASLADAYFGIGLYHYYADVAPAALKLLRILLLLPGGDREQGLREMLQARDRGVLLAGEADYQMHWLYLWYEKDPARALDLLRGLDSRYPSNPLFLERIAEVQRDYRHDRTATIAAWEELLTRATAGRVAAAATAEGQARLGLASERLAINEPQRAIDLVTPLVQRAAATPYGAEARAALLLARAAEQGGDRARAIAHLELAIARAPDDDPHATRAQARTTLARLRSSRR